MHFLEQKSEQISRSFLSFYDCAEDPESRSILRLAEKEEEDAEKAKQLAARIALQSVFFLRLCLLG